MKNAKHFLRILGSLLISALFFCFGGGSLRAQDTYTLVEDASTLAENDEVIIVAASYAKAMSTTQNNNNRGAVDITKNNKTIQPGATVDVFTLKNGTKTDSYAFSGTGGYLCAASSSNNHLRTESSLTDNSSWTIAITSEGVTTITAQGSYTRNIMQYNNSSTIFACYGSASQSGVALYKKQAAVVPTTPFVNTDKNAVSYQMLPTETLNETLRFTAGNLTSDLTVSVASATGGTAVISVDKSTVAKETTDFDLTLTTSTLAEGEYSDTIMIKSGETTMATVTVNLTVALTYPYKKITTDDELKEGVYLIVCDTKNAAAGAMQAGKVFLDAVTVTIANGTINDKGEAEEFQLEKNGTQWNIKNVESGKYLKTTAAKAAAYDGTAFPWTISIASEAATITSSESGHGNLYYNASSPRFLNYTGNQTDIQLYKKQMPETPTCDPVTLPTDGAVTPGQTDATIIWNAPAKVPANGYRVTVQAEGYEKSETTTETQIEWPDELSPETIYTYSIISVCGDDFESEPVISTFTTLAADAPSLDITSPANNTVFSGDVIFAFTTENFELGESKLVKVEVKAQATDQVNAPVLKTLYTQSSPVAIPGLEDGKYHIDLYLANVEGNDTVDVDLGHYVHRNIEVKLPSISFSPESLQLTTYLGVSASGKVQVTGWALSGSSVSLASNNAKFTVEPETLTSTAVSAEGGAEITVTYNGADAAATAEITASCGALSTVLTVNATAKDTLANLKGIYSKADKDTVLVRGKMVVTHKDDYNNRIWVQDIDKETGASMLLFKASNGYADIQVGDVLENILGTVAIYNGLYELTPIKKLVAVEQNHTVYVDTLTVDHINTNIATVQNALVCVERVTFAAATGNFGKNTKYILNQDTKELNFYTTFNNADYIGQTIPTYLLNVVGILGLNTANNNQGTYIVARSKADMAEVPVCEDVEEVACEVAGTTAHFSWVVEHKPAIGYIIEVRTDNEANTLMKRDTVKDPETLTYDWENIPEGEYTYSVTALCGEGNAAEPVEDHFAVHAAGAPSITIVKPAAGEFTRDSVMVTCKVANFVLGTGEDADGSIKYTISGTNLTAPITGTTTDTFFYQKFERSGKDTVRVELVDKNGQPLTPAKTTRRYFTINLPDVAAPVFTPEATTATGPIEVTIECATEGASIFYSLNDAGYVAYTGAVKLEETGTYAFKAYATKTGMDNSATTSKTYTLKISGPLESGVVFYEPFDNLTGASGDISAKLDEYTQLPGWSGEIVYMQVAGIAKMGSSKANGYLQTPAIELTEGNSYVLSFDAQAWNNDSDKLTLKIGETEYEISGLVNTENVGNNNAPTQMKTFEKEFIASAVNTIRFAANGTVGKSRFFLDNVKIRVATDEPTFNVASSLSMNTVLGTSVSKTATVTGRNLAEDVTVTCPEGNFTVAPATLAKEAVMSENGAELTVTFNGSVASDNVTLTLACGGLTKTIEVTATAETATEVENIAALRAGELETTTYKVKGEVVVTAVDGISTWVQDASGAIQIYGSTGNIYAVGDGITGIFGTLKDYSDLIELVPAGDQPAATTHGKVVEPQLMTIEDLNEAGAAYSSRLIRINGLTLNETEQTGWEGGKNYTATDEEGNEITIRTTLSHGSYIGKALPEGKFDLIAIAGIFKGDVQVSPRVAEDIIPAGSGDECEAPTNLEVLGGDCALVTVKWKGSANEYKLVLLSQDGQDTLWSTMLEETEYTFGGEVEKDVEYGWAVASVCADGSLRWARGENFQFTVANENLMEQIVLGVYPNPNNGTLYIELAENARMEIFTVGGVTTRSTELTAGKNEIRFEQSGIFFIRLSNAKGAIVKRVVVR